MRIKGFDKNLCCRGVQFEVGKEYKIDTNGKPLELCTDTVYHYCDTIQRVHEYYPCDENNRYCEIEVLGEEITDGEKYGSNHIKIVREYSKDEIDILVGRINGNTGVFNTGKVNSGDRNSGDRNRGYWNSGYGNSGDRNSGYWNSGYGNSGDRNSGDRNSGNWNSGYGNSGYWNSGYGNSGNWNSGNMNSGNWNSGYGNSGCFCTDTPKARLFNKESNMTISEFYKSEYYKAITSVEFVLTKWIEFTDVELNDDSEKATGGYLITYAYKDACANWWAKMSDDNKKIIMSMPNFNADIFREITGIDVNNDKGR